MRIRPYQDRDEQGWLRCRAVSFLDSSYFTDVKTAKKTYPHPAVCLVAEEAGIIVGFLDVEVDSDDLACNGDLRGAILWHLGVLPEYRKQGVARQMWEQAKSRLLDLGGVRYCEVWTQEDPPANAF